MIIIRALVGLNALLLVAGGIALVLMAVHVSLDAFGKYALATPKPATLEIVAYYYMPAVVALPLAYVEMRNGHVAVDLLHQLFPPLLQKVVLFLNGLITASFLGILCWLAGVEAIRKFQINEFMFGEYPIIIWPGRFVFTLGFAFFALVVVVKAGSLLFGTRDPFLGRMPFAEKEDGA